MQKLVEISLSHFTRRQCHCISKWFSVLTLHFTWHSLNLRIQSEIGTCEYIPYFLSLNSYLLVSVCYWRRAAKSTQVFNFITNCSIFIFFTVFIICFEEIIFTMVLYCHWNPSVSCLLNQIQIRAFAFASRGLQNFNRKNEFNSGML